jgi:hypothetical protein
MRLADTQCGSLRPWAVYRLCHPIRNSHTAPTAPIRVMSLRATQERENMKLIIGRPDETEVVLAEQVNGAWKPNPNIASEMVSFLQGADPEQFEMWVEEPE